MKYRHSFHAGNFADVHKHIALLALLRALKKKGKGFLYLETHAGRGGYDLSGHPAEAAGGVGRFLEAQHEAPELRDYAAVIAALRARTARRHLYPGSPLVAAAELRAQDRAVLIELQGAEAHALEQSLSTLADARASGLPVRVERGDGFLRLKAFLPPPERRGLTFIDPPYEETQQDFRPGCSRRGTPSRTSAPSAPGRASVCAPCGQRSARLPRYSRASCGCIRVIRASR